MRLIYVFDAYCGWSHGFSATLREVMARHPELPVEVVSGGLFLGPRRRPVREFGFIKGANATIHDVTGAAQAGLDGDAIAAAFADPRSRAAAAADFDRTARLGVTGFPTLLVAQGDTTTPIAYGNASAAQVDEGLAALPIR